MLLAILTSPATGQPTFSRDSIEVLPEGLAGDRYALGKGIYSDIPEWGAHVTLVQREPFDDLRKNHGIHIDTAELRRNLITSDISLPWLIGREFQIGSTVILRARKLWPPCKHIVQLTGKREIFSHLARQCGIGADVIVPGRICVGDVIFATGK